MSDRADKFRAASYRAAASELTGRWENFPFGAKVKEGYRDAIWWLLNEADVLDPPR